MSHRTTTKWSAAFLAQAEAYVRAVAIVRGAVEASDPEELDFEDAGPIDHASAVAYVRRLICAFSDPIAIQERGSAVLPVLFGSAPIGGANEIASWQQANPGGIGAPPGLGAAMLLDRLSSNLPTWVLSQMVFGAVASMAWIVGANNGVASDTLWERIDSYLNEVAGDGEYALGRQVLELRPDEAGDSGDESLWQSILIGEFGGRDVRIGRSGRVQWQYHDAEANANAESESEGVDDVIEELDNLVGLATVKNQIRSIRDFVEVEKKRQSRGMTGAPLTLHAAMTGNPGTGKTTVARILARVYKALGVLSSG